MSLLSYLYRLITIKKINNNFLTNIENIEEMNIVNYDIFRKVGVSWILRVKNWEDYLEKVILSCIDFFDEIIIINNLSTDNTEKISISLEKKYKDKIKYYNYPYKIIRNKDSLTNSVYSLAYYYNWSFSKSSYDTVCKLDDDGLFIKDLIWDQINKVRNSFFKKYFYFYYRGLNVYKKNNLIWVVNLNPYSWRYWDIWFYYLNNKTYYIQDWFTEKFISNKFYFDLGFSYLHLKYLKKENWLEFAPIHLKNFFNNILKETKIDNIDCYVKKLTQKKLEEIVNNISSNSL